MNLTKEEFLNNFPYKNIRVEQKYILEKIFDNYDKYEYFVIEAPTGTGKSAICETLLKSFKYSCILTSTKYLQDQYVQEFNTFSIKGKSNYLCNRDPMYSCNEAICSSNSLILNDCLDNHYCEFYNKLNNIKDNYVKSYVTSYSLFFEYNIIFTNKLLYKKYDLVILDECHLLENNLVSKVGFTLNIEELNEKYDIYNYLQFDELIKVTSLFNGDKDKELDVIKILFYTLNKIYSQYENKSTDELIKNNKLIIKGELSLLILKINSFLNSYNYEDDWIIDGCDNTLSIQPINIKKHFKYYIDNYARKKIFLSATLINLDKYIEDLGIDPSKVLKIKIPSTFDPYKSPIIYYPSGKMSYKEINNSLNTICNNIKYILNKHKNEKGIIHTNNYTITKKIIDRVNDPRLIYTDKNINNEELLRIHKQSKNNTVIISPSLYNGANLENELSRFQIIVKLPFLSLGDKRVSKKAALDSDWYTMEMLRILIQMCGRSTRSKEDYSVTYVLDNAFYYYMYNNIKYFNKSFTKRIIFNKDKFNIDKYRKYIKGENNE